MSEEAIVVWRAADIERFAAKAKEIVESREALNDYLATELMQQTVLLGEGAKMMLIEGGKTGKALPLSVGAKLHAEWREVMMLFAKRLWEKKEKGGAKGNRTGESASTPGRRSAGADGPGGGGASGRDARPDVVQAGLARVVEGS